MQKFRTMYLFPVSLIILEIAIFLSNDMYLPSMPSIAHDLGLSKQEVQYTLTLWFLGSSSLQLFLGPVSDRFGRRSMVILGGVVYVASSYICALANDYSIFLIARFIQGATICAVLVAGGAAIHESCSTKMAIKIFSFINAVTILAPAFGPLFGALIIQFANWRFIFYILTFLGVIGTVLILLFMPETNNAKHAIHFRRISGDYLKIIKNKEYMLPSISYCLLLSIFFLWMFEAPFIMLETYQLSGLYYGVSQTMIFGCFFIGAELTRYILNRHTLNRLINISLLITIIGTVAFAFVAKFINAINAATASLMVISLGASMLFAPLSRLAMEASKVPMGCRYAIFSTLIGLFGALSGWLISLITVHDLSSVAVLIVICVALAIICLLKTKIPVLFTDES